MNLVLLGGGGHAKAVAYVARSAGYRILGVLTPGPERELPGLPRLGDDGWMNQCTADIGFHVAIGPSHGSTLRADIFGDLLARGKRLPQIVAPSAIVCGSAVLGQGSVIMHRVVVNADARIGENCILNTGSVVEHDCIVEEHVHLAPAALLLGGARVGPGCIVGGGAVILPGVTVAGGVLIGAGAVVTRSIDEFGGNLVRQSRAETYMSVPWSKGRTFLIAEAGVNHNGDERLAIEMVELAARAGADAVKFQTFRAEKLATASAGMASYQEKNTGAYGSQLDMLRNLELSQGALVRVKRRAEELGIAFFSTGFDDESNDFLTSLDQPIWKIPSGEITNFPYLVRIARLARPTILSTGMATLAEVAEAVETLEKYGLSRDLLCVLHCNTEYPTPMTDVNLRAMERLGKAFDCTYGYSDHTNGVIVSIAAVARGAVVIEKHFTLDPALPGPDHAASMSPEELHDWVAAVRATEIAMGSPVKMPTRSERKNRALGRKVIVAAESIKAGERFSADNLTVKRAGGVGITAMRWPEIIDRTAPRSFDPDEPIEL